MANRDTPFGLRPLRNINGDAPRVKKYPATSAVIFEGQIVQLQSNGSALGATGTYLNTSVARDILGVALHYKAANATPAEILVHQDFGGELYVIQADDGTITNAAGCVGSNFPVVGASSGSTATGQSKAELDASGASTATASAAGLHLKCIEAHKLVGNALATVANGGSNVDLVVSINRRNLHYVRFGGV